MGEQGGWLGNHRCCNCPIAFDDRSVPKCPTKSLASPTNHRRREDGFIAVKDGNKIYYKDWGTGQPIVFHHGWPSSDDDWDTQMMFFLAQGYRVIAHDRRGHGRSTQTFSGNDVDTYAADVDELVTALKLTNAIHVGHSTGGGEVIRYVVQHGKGRIAYLARYS